MTTNRITVHSKTNCPHCVRAKAFLHEKGLPFDEIVYDPLLSPEEYETRKNELVLRTQFRTFPQIFIGDEFLGGFSELTDAYATLKLHSLCLKIGKKLDIEF